MTLSKKYIVILMVAVQVTLCRPLAAMDDVSGEGYWLAWMGADTAPAASAPAGKSRSPLPDLVADNEATPFEIAGRHGNHYFNISYHGNQFEVHSLPASRNQLPAPDLTATDPPQEPLKVDVFDLTYQYTLPRVEEMLPNVSVGLVGRLKIFEGYSDMQPDDEPAQEEPFRKSYAMPGVDLNIGIFDNTVKAHVQASGMENKHGSIFDGQADISLTLSPRIDLLGGYRFFFIDMIEDDYTLQQSNAGPFVGISLSF